MFEWKKTLNENKLLISLWEFIPDEWFQKIEVYFNNNTSHLEILNNINNKNRNQKYISLRKINFFITMYSKIHKTTFGDNNMFIFHEYDQQLSYYRRKYFDPFRRGNLEVRFSYYNKNNRKMQKIIEKFRKSFKNKENNTQNNRKTRKIIEK